MHNRKGMLNFATLLISQISNIYNTMLQEITITLSVWQHLLLMTYVAFNIVILAFYVDNLFQEKLLYKYLSIVFILYFGLIFYLLVKLWELCEWVVVKTYIHYWFQIWFTSEFNDMSEAWVERLHKNFIAKRRTLTWFQKAFYFAMRRRNLDLFKKIEDNYRDWETD